MDNSEEVERENDDKIQIVTSDPLLESINQILEQAALPPNYSDGIIYKVPEPLRSIKPQAYTPTVVSIGPFHSHRKDLMVNSWKPRFLQHFLELSNLPINTILQTVKNLEKGARCCYAESIDMNTDEFVQLLVLDGCFTVMYLIIAEHSEFRSPNIGNVRTFRDEIFCDLLLLENQLPFFLLKSLFDLCPPSDYFQKHVSFIDLVRGYLIKGSNEKGLDFLQTHLVLSTHIVHHFVGLLTMHFTHTCSDDNTWFHSTFWPPTATELHECGVVFKTKEKCAVDVAFIDCDGYLELPKIIIDDGFETRVRNMIAYEQLLHAGRVMRNNEVSNFAVFMKFLVQTEQDVKLLIEYGIINNNLGSIKEVTQLFNNLCKNVAPGNNFYNNECKRMKGYCKRRHHRWMATLRRNYFSTPWVCASSIAAILLLTLTLVQTVVSVIALYGRNS